MTVAIHTTPLIPKSTSDRRKRDLCRRASSIALSVCKILRRLWNMPDWWRTSENGCPHLQTGNRKGIQYCRWGQPISLSRPLLLCVLLRVISLIKSVSLVRFRERGGGVSPWKRICSSNYRRSSYTARFIPATKVNRRLDKSSSGPQGFSGKSPHPQGGSISPKKLA